MTTSSQSITSVQAIAGINPKNKPGNETPYFNNFIQLLTTELRNQDPLKPLDPTQTVTQLATFASVEQAVKSNDLLSKLVNQSTDFNSLLLIGKTLSTVSGDKLGVVTAVTNMDSTPIAVLDTGKHISITPELVIT